MRPRCLLLVNTRARRKEAFIEAVRSLVGRALLVELASSRSRGEGARLARRAAEEGVSLVISLGGDGTHADALSGLAGTPLPLGALPGGSLNLLPRHLGVPRDPRRAVAALLTALEDGRVMRLPLFLAAGVPFYLGAGAGPDATAVSWLERAGGLKRLPGSVGYAAALGAALLAGGTGRRLRFETAEAWGEASAVVLVTRDPYAYLAGIPFHLVPGLPAGRLDLLAFEDLGVLSLPGLFFSLVSGVGSHLERAPVAGGSLAQGLRSVFKGRKAIHLEGVKWARLQGLSGPFPFHADGEWLGERWEVEVVASGEESLVLAPRLAEEDLKGAGPARW